MEGEPGSEEPKHEEPKHEEPEGITQEPGASENRKPEEAIRNDEPNPEVIRVAELLLSGRNVALRGPGGTGKSHLLKEVALYLEGKGHTVYRTGSTGVAAENIKGMTLHSWSGIQLGDKDVATHYMIIQGRGAKALRRWRTTEFLFIDEISMVGGNLFDKLDKLGRMIRKYDRPFGGIPICVCGDMCQLPPVKDKYFFLSDVYPQMDFQHIKLSHPWRFQKDIDFFYMLSRIRIGEHTPDDIAKLEARKVAYYKEMMNRKFRVDEIRPTKLFARKVDVDAMNLKELELLPFEEFRYEATDHLKRKVKDTEFKLEHFQGLMDKNVPPAVSLKKGAQVMLTWNLDVETMGLCNGSRGVVIECFDDCVQVKFRNGAEIMVYPNTWTFETDGEVFTRTQMPLILAYAITIHKSQSATLDYVIVDIGTSIFGDNMAYVALSRCRNIEGVFLNNLIPEKIRCDPLAKQYELEN